ncbi:MAG TPA: acyl-CoA dehydrogenase family protein [Acetobacteraceae bacterium]|nr:acyl-CoA dehydrogenase family protein [Acetobacteraceae bacterium]
MDVQASGNLDSDEAHIERARGLTRLLAEAGPRIDAARELPPDVLDAMHGAGMFRLLVPRRFGGAELLPAPYVQCVEAIASGDGSTAWCMNQGSGCSMSAAYLPEDAAREVFGGARDVLAWGQARGRARADKVPGGWRVTGTWLFASGSRHATWLGAHCPVFDASGTQICGPDGAPIERTMLFRREKAMIDDVWQVVGLRGTGSDTYSVEDLFVPDDYSLCRDADAERREDGLLYRFTTTNIYAAGFGAVGLGVARGMLDAFIALASKKSPYGSGAMRDSAVVQAIVGLSDAKLRAARAWLIEVLERTQENVAARGHLVLQERLDIRQAATFAIHLAREVVNALWHEAGATAIFDNQPFERRFRDMNTVSQQVQGRSAHFETIGQHMLGLEAPLRWV